MEGSEGLKLPDEQLEQTIPEEPLESVSETPEAGGEQSPQAETPKKVLGLFSDEQEAINTLRDLTNRLGYYEQNEKHQLLRQQEEYQQAQSARQEELRQQRLRQQEEQWLREASYVHDQMNRLYAEGRGAEAVALQARYNAKYVKEQAEAAKREATEQMQRAEQERAQAIAYWKQDYMASKLGQMIPELADEAAVLVTQGWPREEVAKMFLRLRGDDRQQKARDAKNRALRDGFIEPPDGGSLATAPNNDSFDKLLKKHTKSFFDE